MSGQSTRLEHDLLGEKAVPADAYYGVQTARAPRELPHLRRAAAPLPRSDQGARDGEDGGRARQPRVRAVRARTSSQGIEGACQELIDGKLHDQFRLDVFQGGAGTSTNMNANEVIANRALELMGHAKGEYSYCDPHDHVNGSQSTNDAYPTALHVGMALGNARLIAAMNELIAAFRAQGPGVRRHSEDGPDAAAGRRADDARPGVQRVWRDARRRGPRARRRSSGVLCEINMGATAIGTGLNAPAGYAEKCTEHLAAITGLPIYLADEPDRGDAGHAGVRPLLVVHEEPGDQALEGLQRPAAAVVGPALRPARDQPAGQAAGLVDHAGQGQPGHPRGRQHGLLPGHRQRPDHLDGGRSRAAAAERLRTGHRRLHLRGADAVHQRGADAARALRRRHHGQPRRLPPLRRLQHRHRHRAQSRDRLRAIHRARGRGR